jgi:hypothetical protein
VLNPIIDKYKNKIRIKKLRKLKFKTFKEVISLKAFKEFYIKDFYSNKELIKLKKIFNMNQMTLDAALIKRSILNKIVVKKYNSLFYLKELPNRFLKRKRKYFKRKKRKRKLNLRVKFFYRITYDNFLFYLNVSNKQLIIKPFNFFNCLFFYKTKTFRKAYVIRKRRRMRFRFYYKFRRRKKRRSIRRRRIRYLHYRFKKKFLMKRFKQIKIRKYKNFLRFIAFFNLCKKINLKVDDHFKTKSILHLPYKLLKFNFNKITNSYNFFLNFNSQRKHKNKIKNKIKLFDDKEIFNKKRTKFYTIIKFKLKNRFINSNTNKPLENMAFYKLFLKKKSIVNTNQSLLYNPFPDYLISNDLIKKTIKENYQINISNNYLKKSYEKNKLLKLVKLINKLSKKILFFEKKIINLKINQKKRLSILFSSFLKINKNIIKKFKRYKRALQIIKDIILNLKQKLKQLIINFYVLFIYINDINILKKKTNKNFLKKIFFFLKRKKKRKQKKKKSISKLKKNKQLLLSFFFYKSKLILSKNKKFVFSYTNKLNNFYKKPWKRRKLKKKKNKRIKNVFLRHIKKNFSFSNFFLYKNYFNKKYLFKKKNYSHFCNKKFKYIYLNFLKKITINSSKNLQKNKNINFLNY